MPIAVGHLTRRGGRPRSIRSPTERSRLRLGRRRHLERSDAVRGIGIAAAARGLRRSVRVGRRTRLVGSQGPQNPSGPKEAYAFRWGRKNTQVSGDAATYDWLDFHAAVPITSLRSPSPVAWR